ncbi:MAG: hypothetical protein V4681_01980 [Patescibacteria group bacterium]
MAPLSHHLERVRAKPHHEQRKIAFATALGVTGLVTLGWLGALASSPVLALNPRSNQSEELNMQDALTDTRSNFSELAGAAAAAIGATTSPARITVVDTKTTSTLDAPKQNHNDTHETVLTF